MARIIVEIDDSKAALLQEKAEKFGFLPEQLVSASINDLIGQPDSEFETILLKVLSKNKELYQRLS